MIWTTGTPVGEILSSLRDFSIIVGIFMLGWKGRAAIQPIVEFFQRANRHMTIVEGGLQLLLDNHMKHIQESVTDIHKRVMQVSDLSGYKPESEK